MVIKGKRVFKTRVRVKGDDVELIFYTQSARGTPVMLGSVTPKRSEIAQAIQDAVDKPSPPSA